jgi:hypothetical protein
MNKKQIILSLFLLISTKTYSETFAMEMTFPNSALLWVTPNDVWTRNTDDTNYYWPSGGWPALPQTQGYFATSNQAWIVLQRGGYYNGFNCTTQSDYANPLIYFSDIHRASYEPDNGPLSAYARGCCGSNLRFGQQIMYEFNHNQTNFRGFYQQLKKSALGMQIGGANPISVKKLELNYAAFAPINMFNCSYYFAQTGYGVYLPLHMIAPITYDGKLQNSFGNIDGAWTNFGPARRTTNPYYGKETATITTQQQPYYWPWGWSYTPPNIPQIQVNSLVDGIFPGVNF